MNESITLTATNESVPGIPFPFAGASAAVLTTGRTEPMCGQVTLTVTPRVGYTTREPPEHADAPFPVMFQPTERTTVYDVPSITNGSPAA
ncbi:MAG: hypothetical protein ACOH2F_16925 [Cellulomonas sp.]